MPRHWTNSSKPKPRKRAVSVWVCTNRNKGACGYTPPRGKVTKHCTGKGCPYLKLVTKSTKS